MLPVALAALPLFAALVHAATFPNTCTGLCDLSKARLSLPANQNSLMVPTGPPSFVALGVGQQNYTCNDTSSTYTSFGAVVEVLDISCLVGSYFFDTIQTYAYDIWTNMSPGETTQDLIKKLGTDPLVLGQHYFVGNSTSLHPVWDFRANVEQGNAAGYILAEVVGDIPAPTGPNDVDWLQLKKVEGELADAVYRVDTKGGQPPASCKPGDSMVSVKFTTKYWLFGGY